MKLFRSLVVVSAVSALFVACGGQVASEEQARRAYLGLDKAIGKSLTLGFAGFNAASSANIAPQNSTGDKSGTLTITGQVDQGASVNKGMRLKVEMVNYSDGDVVLDGGEKVAIVYATDGGLPALDLSLRNIPTGTLTGTLVGDFGMDGDLKGTVRLDLSMSGQLEPGDGGTVQRKAGTTTVTGTATSGAGVYQVNVSL